MQAAREARSPIAPQRASGLRRAGAATAGRKSQSPRDVSSRSARMSPIYRGYAERPKPLQDQKLGGGAKGIQTSNLSAMRSRMSDIAKEFEAQGVVSEPRRASSLIPITSFQSSWSKRETAMVWNWVEIRRSRATPEARCPRISLKNPLSSGGGGRHRRLSARQNQAAPPHVAKTGVGKGDELRQFPQVLGSGRQ